MLNSKAHSFHATAKSLLIALAVLFSFSAQTFACTYANDPGLAAQQQECNSSGANAQRWDCNLNRCVNTAEAVEDRNEYKACLAKEDMTKQKQCFDDFAKNEASKDGFKQTSENKGSGLETGAMAINTIFAAMIAINLIAKDGKGSNCTSANIAGVSAAGGMLAYFYLHSFAKKKVDELRENYENEKVMEGDAYNAQVRAFEYLKSEQEAVAEYAKKRKNAYTLLTVGYTAAFGFAIYDAAQNPECGTEKEGEGEETAGDAGTDEADKGFFESIGDGASAVASGVTKFTGFMTKPAGIMIISGLGAAYSGFLAIKAGEQQKEAEDNAEKIDAIIAKFKDTVAGYCPNGRESLSEPRCYCYNDDGSQNKDHDNSATCQTLWAADQKNYNIAATDYNKVKITETKGCMLITREFDADCKCRKLINSKGENACFKSNFGAVGFNGLGQSLGTPSFSRNIDSLSSGATTFGNLNTGSLGQQAKRNKSINDKLIKTTNLKRRQQGQSPLQSITQPLIDKFTKQLVSPKAIRALASKQNTIQSSRPTKGKLAAALSKATKDIKKDGGLNFKKGTANSRGRKNNDDFNFQFSNPDAKNAGNLSGFKSKPDYDYKENDIVKREDLSIWKVISHRYTQSGLKRLFSDDKVLPPSAETNPE